MNHKLFHVLLALLCTSIIFSACNASAPAEQQNNEKQGQTEFTDVTLLTEWDGTCSGATGEKGYYYIEINNDGSMHVMYLDYATKLQTILCASPSCQHKDASCSAWIPANQGGVVPFIVNNSLFVVSRGSENISQNVCKPQLVRMDLDGRNKITLLQLNANEELLPPFATDGAHIVCGYCSYESTEDATILKRTIVAIDVNSGQMTELVDLSDSPANIVGAVKDNLLLLEVSEDTFSLFSLNLSTKETTKLDSWKYGEKVLFTTKEGYGFITADGHVQFSNMIGGEVPNLDNIIIPLDKNYGLDLLNFRVSYDNKAIFEVCYLGDTPADTQNKKFGIDLEHATMCELHLCTTFDGVTEPIDIVAILDKELLVVENLAYQSVTMLDENNLPIEVTSIANQYALIKKEDYWNSVPNYNSFQSIWFQ